MAAQQIEYTVVMNDGRELPVVVDQRDIAKLEVQPYGPEQPFTRTRFLVWSALYREQRYKGSFLEFNEVDCVEVQLPDDEPKDTDALNPGPAGRPATA